jgi:uncharacterized membrane protein
MKKLFLLACVIGFASACGSDAEEREEEEELPPVVNCAAVQPVPKFSDVQAFQAVCTHCHSSGNSGAARNEAPIDINFDQYASASAHARQAAIEVNAGAMPPSSSNLTLTEVQKTTLFNWAMCGAPQ